MWGWYAIKNCILYYIFWYLYSLNLVRHIMGWNSIVKNFSLKLLRFHEICLQLFKLLRTENLWNRIGTMIYYAGIKRFWPYYMTPSLTGTDHMYVKVNSSQYCEEFCCHKITSSKLNISELVFFYYVNIFCKKLKYWIMPNFSNVWIRPQLVFYYFNFKPKLFSTKKPT